MGLKFEDLSQFDLDLIKSNAIHLFVNHKNVIDRCDSLTDSLLTYIYSKGFNVNVPPKVLATHVRDLDQDKNTRTLTANEMLLCMFQFLELQDFKIIKDDKRQPTWSKLEKSVYAVGKYARSYSDGRP